MNDDLLDSLLKASSKREYGIVLKLIADNSSIGKFVFRNDTTALIALSYFGNNEIVHKLIEKGSDVNHIDKQGLSPLLSSLQGEVENKNTLQTSKLLLLNGADPNLHGYLGQTPLHFAIRKKLYEQTKLILEFGGDPFVKTKDIDTENSFDISLQTKSKKMIELLDKKIKRVSVDKNRKGVGDKGE